MTAGSVADRFATALGARLDDAADERTRRWWTDYLKGAASFRGVKMATVRRIVDELVDELGLDDASADRLLTIASACLARPDTEDKLGGVLLLAEHGLDRLRIGHVARLGRPLARGHLADWNSVDWYCVKVLGPYIAGADDVEERATAIAAWTSADVLWQRRAAAVSFIDLASKPPPFPGFDDLLVAICAANAADPARWSQTSVGWLLREWSRHQPDRVREFVETHDLSSEARRTATAKLP